MDKNFIEKPVQLVKPVKPVKTVKPVKPAKPVKLVKININFYFQMWILVPSVST